MKRIIIDTDGISIQESTPAGEAISLSLDERGVTLKARMMLTTQEPIRTSLTLQFDMTPQDAIRLRDWLTKWLETHAGDPEVNRAVEDAKIVTHAFNLFNPSAAVLPAPAEAPAPRPTVNGMAVFDLVEEGLLSRADVDRIWGKADDADEANEAKPEE